MSFLIYWSKLSDKTPSLKEDNKTKMTLTIAVFKEELRKSYEAGRKDGKEDKPLKDNGSVMDYLNKFLKK